jgi:hypothetical protein
VRVPSRVSDLLVEACIALELVEAGVARGLCRQCRWDATSQVDHDGAGAQAVERGAVVAEKGARGRLPEDDVDG